MWPWRRGSIFTVLGLVGGVPGEKTPARRRFIRPGASSGFHTAFSRIPREAEAEASYVAGFPVLRSPENTSMSLLR